jgi:hypothetical protein
MIARQAKEAKKFKLISYRVSSLIYTDPRF